MTDSDAPALLAAKHNAPSRVKQAVLRKRRSFAAPWDCLLFIVPAQARTCMTPLLKSCCHG
ncbi:MAG TPA: hypothetical protein VGE72_19295 [Azospirillum sp.]